jgi:hypothetical protein
MPVLFTIFMPIFYNCYSCREGEQQRKQARKKPIPLVVKVLD